MPERQVWRLINCGFSAIAICGTVDLIKQGLNHFKMFSIYKVSAFFMLITTLILPLIVGVPEKRFGLTFHPFFVLAAGHFISKFWLNHQQAQLKVSLIITLSLFLLSLRIETFLFDPMDMRDLHFDATASRYDTTVPYQPFN